MNSFSFDETNTFCISLENSRGRWQRITERFAHFQMNVQKWKAATADDLKDPFWHCLNTGERGCAQSHINIWRHIVSNGLKYALVLEDDACFDKEWRTKLDVFCKNNGYVISFKGAQSLLNDFGGCFFSSDWMTSRLQHYNHCYCYFPWLIVQEGKDSTIGCKVDADHAKVVRCLQEIDYSLDNYI